MLRQAKPSATNDFVAYRRALRGAGIEATEDVKDIVSGLQEFLLGGAGGGGGASEAATAAAGTSGSGAGSQSSTPTWGGVARLLKKISQIAGGEDVVLACVHHAVDVISEAMRTGAGINIVHSPSSSSSHSSPSAESGPAGVGMTGPGATVPIPLLFPERFSLVRGLAVALSCLVGPGTEPLPILRTPTGKKLFESAIKIMRNSPVIPIIGDVQTTPLTLLRALRGLRNSKDLAVVVDAAVLTTSQAEQFRSAAAPAAALAPVTAFATRFLKRFTHTATAAAAAKGSQGVSSLDQSTRNALHALTLEGLGLMSAIGGAIATQAALNLAYPAPNSNQVAGHPAQAMTRYERAMRASHSAADRAALLDAIGALKAVDAEMARWDATLVGPVLLAAAKTATLSFAMETMTHMIKSATKHKRSIARTLGGLREALTSSPEPATGAEYASERLHVLRAAASELVVGSGGQTKSLFNRAMDFSATSLKELTMAEGVAWAHQVALSGPAIRAELVDLSHLWLREAHLEMAALEPSAQVGSQFPATMSLPWILAEHTLGEAMAAAEVRGCGGVLNTDAGRRLADVLLLPFAIHADAAAAALRLPSPSGSTANVPVLENGDGSVLTAPWRVTPHGGATALGVRHLFLEVRAEAELCWDQLLFRLAAAAHASALNGAAMRWLHPALRAVALGKEENGQRPGGGNRGAAGLHLGDGNDDHSHSSEGNGLGPLVSRMRRVGRPFSLLGRHADLPDELWSWCERLCVDHTERLLSTFEAGGGGKGGVRNWGQRAAIVTGVVELDAAVGLARSARDELEGNTRGPSMPRAEEVGENKADARTADEPPVAARAGTALENAIVSALMPGFTYDGVYRRFECPETTPITIGEHGDEDAGGPGGGARARASGGRPGGGGAAEATKTGSISRLNLLCASMALPPRSDRSPAALPPGYLLSASLAHLSTHFGFQHADATAGVLGPWGLGHLATVVARRVQRVVIHGLLPHIKQLIDAKAVPSDIDYPDELDEYGTMGVHGHLQLQLKAVAGYSLLRAEVLHRAREAGNGILFLMLLDEAAERARFAGMELAPPLEGEEGEEGGTTEMGEDDWLGAVVEGAKEWNCDWWDARTWGDGAEGPWKNKGNARTQPWGEEESGGAFPGGTPGPISGPPERSVMPYFLRGLRAAMYGAGWTPGSEASRGFPRAWSAVQYAACAPLSGALGEDDPTARESFGDGVVWCGGVLSRLLGYPAKVGKFVHRWEEGDFACWVMKAREREEVATATSPLEDGEKKKKEKKKKTHRMPSAEEKRELDGWMAAAEEWREETRSVFFALDRWLRGSDLCPEEYDLSHITPPTKEEVEALVQEYLVAQDRVFGKGGSDGASGLSS